MCKKMCFISAAFLFVLFTNGNAQLSFDRHVACPITTVNVISSVDLDSDSDMDIIGGSGTDSYKVFWLENLLSGNFVFHVIDGVANGVTNGQSIYASDLNNDGFIDVIAALTKPSGPVSDNEVAWYENDGHQGFTKHRIYSWGQPDYVFGTDLDDDGDNDVLATFWGIPENGQLVWFENDGNGNFANHIVAYDYRMGRSVIAADFDGDGDKDIVSTQAYRYARMDWWENDGNENFTYQFIDYGIDCVKFETHDFNDDGILDLLYTSVSSSRPEITWLSWQGHNPIKHIVESTRAYGSSAADLDDDGDLEILANIYDTNMSCYYVKTVSGYTKYVLDGNNGKALSITTADFDNDGDADAAIASLNAGKIYWYENLLNHPPIANADDDQTVEATSSSGAEVTLDGSGSHDPDGDLLTYTWRENSTIIAGPTNSPTAAVTLALGSHTIELTVADEKGAVDTDEVVMDVVDTTPPTLSVSVEPNMLWPPNHKMIAIHATVTVSDFVDPNATFVLTSIVSNEPDNGLGDGDKPNDIQEAEYGTPDLDFKLRAERSGKGNGRIYTVTYTATDASGNSSSTTATVTVPHDMGQPDAAPANFDLFDNHPNPFNQETQIRFQLPVASYTVLKIFNTLGQEIRTILDQQCEAGYHSVRWDGRDNNGNLVVSGTYLYQIKAGDFVAIKKLVVLK
ncbi:MAG: FG-GAP-like repeat-containing protein [candidate division KSB1 bacterium]|nr:FG-GAP-like repeat-containing protein [candidate division KSB1 bacterium]